jgi:hypothetical protein
MKRISRKFFVAAMSVSVATGLACTAFAQDSGYRIGENSGQAPLDADPSSAGQDAAPVDPQASGPVRMARFSYLNGNVTWRPDPQTEWAPATDNMPLREGSEIWVGDGGRAELQFDDGSYFRFGSGAVATLQTLFSDSQGEYTEIKLTDGLASMELRTDHSVYQIDTPKGAIRSVGPSRVRVGVDDDVEVGVRLGTAVLERSEGNVTLHSNDYVDLQATDRAPQVSALPPEDSWDKFTDERSALMMHPDPNLPENMQSVGGDLDNSGTWREDPEYGKVWAPEEPDSWQPYQQGSWVWCNPFGWTWVGSESWGWLPYHYGSWIHRGWGWAWVPGPVNQYWSPGVVDFSCYGDNVCWTPLAPFECHYPASFGLGVWGTGWGAWFSIGFCGVWSPFGSHYCGERPWNNGWLNHVHGGGFYGDHGGFGAHPRLGGEVGFTASRFQPANAGFATISASRSGFGDGGHYSSLGGRAGQEAFARGQSIGGRGSGLVNGPANVVRPTSTSWAGGRGLTSRPEGTGILNRGVYRGANDSRSDRGNSSAAGAAQRARESLGWTSRGSSSYSRSGGGSDWSRPFSSSNRGGGGESRSPSHSTGGRSGWSVPDHSGWSHVHSDSGGSGNRGGGGGGGSHGGGNQNRH